MWWCRPSREPSRRRPSAAQTALRQEASWTPPWWCGGVRERGRGRAARARRRVRSGGSLLSRLDLRLSVVSVPSATATDGERAAQSASARDPRLAVAGHLRDPGGQLTGCDVGDGDVLDD